MAESDAVTVWRLALKGAVTQRDRLWPLLAEEEKQRACAYSHAEAAGRFVLCRAALRILLGERLGLPPAEIRLTRGLHGKPCLADASSFLAFNVSHTDNWALIALGSNAALGIDVEVHRPLKLELLARRVLAPSERGWWNCLPIDAQRSAFFTLWTRKEAFAKAVGRGIALGLQNIVFNAEGALAGVPKDYGTPQDWLVLDLAVAKGHSASLVARRPVGFVKLQDFVFPEL